MKADDIRKVNELCQKQAQDANSIGAQESGLRSLECSMLAEIAAQLCEANENMKIVLNPPLVWNKTERNLLDLPEFPQPEFPQMITAMQPRLTMRDQFAMAALAGLLSDHESSGPKGCAEAAYNYADAMMEARK